jgi:YidC/Oxa1 family membrane protein insertase
VTLSFLSPLYNAVSWLMAQIHTGLSTFLPSTSGEAWFLTIVVLVVLMRLVLVPLFVKQMHAMRKMSALTPQLQELRKKYKGDKQTLNEETMRLYKEAGVNPLGGCLPLLAQMPVFFALFTVLREIAGWHTGLALPFGFTETTVKSAQDANILGAHISDKVLFTHGMYVPLHAKIVILCFVAISVTTTFLTVRQSTKRGMTPQMTPDNPMAASQKYMAYIVPFFALSGLYWAFGLVLYWVTTNVWTLGQQYVLFKRYPPTAPATASSPAVSAKPATAAGLVAGGKPSAPRSAADAVKRPPQARPAAKQPVVKAPVVKAPVVKAAAAADAVKRQAAYKEAASGEPLPAPAKPATAAKPAGAAKPGSTKSGSAKPAPAKPSGSSSQRQGNSSSQRQGKKTGSGAPAGGSAQGRPAGKPAPATNGSGSGPGILRRFGRGKAETEEETEAPEVKLVRQQRVRQSRSKRSGKH